MGYYQPPPPGYGAPPQPYGAVPPEAQSIKSMVNIASIFGILFAILFIFVLLFGLWVAFWGTVVIGLGGVGLVYIVIGILGMLFGFMFYSNCRAIGKMVDARQYEQAKSKALIWMIIGIIFVGLIPGIILLIAYLKFDPLINAARAMAYAPAPGYGTPPPQQQQRLCLGCGQQIPLNFNNCPHCGKAVGQAGGQQQGGNRMCLGCGQQIQSNFKVCPHCGRQS